MKFGTFCLEFCQKKSLNLFTRKLNGKNPDWTEDRENYDQVSPVHENLRKSTSTATTKVRPNYDQGGQKKFLKSLFLLKGGPIQKIAFTGVNKF